VRVRSSATHAFEVFTAGFDRWWPRDHHIGKSPMKRAILEPRVGGRCYSEQEDGTECDWGSVLAWEPPRRIVLSWQITKDWTYEPDVAKSSEVEITFTEESGGFTRVDLEHRAFERMGAGAQGMRGAVDSPNGWGLVLRLYQEETER
jgi:uncharacterized protein YndB with AHSA1/START domain